MIQNKANIKQHENKTARRAAIVLFSYFILHISYLFSGCQYTIEGNPDIDLTEVHLSPITASVPINGKLILTASVLGFSNTSSVTWSVDGGTTNGTITANGLSATYIPPALIPQVANVRITSSEDQNRAVICPVYIIVPNDTAFSVSPSSETLLTNAIQQFTIDTLTDQSPIPPLRWDASAGSITDSGIFSAPMTIGSDSVQIVVRAISLLDSSVFSESTITVRNSSDSLLCFTRDILPTLSANCGMSGCHDASTHASGYDFGTYSGTFHSIHPGDARSSRLYTAITQFNVNNRMPPPPAPALAPNQVLKIGEWIDEGAVDCQ